MQLVEMTISTSNMFRIWSVALWMDIIMTRLSIINHHHPLTLMGSNKPELQLVSNCVCLVLNASPAKTMIHFLPLRHGGIIYFFSPCPATLAQHWTNILSMYRVCFVVVSLFEPRTWRHLSGFQPLPGWEIKLHVAIERKKADCHKELYITFLLWRIVCYFHLPYTAPKTNILTDNAEIFFPRYKTTIFSKIFQRGDRL